MRITRLHIQGIRQHADLDITPAAGLTVVRGPNESGKSTVQTALEMALFHDPTSTAPALQDLRTWGSDGDARVRLEFEHEGKPGHLEKVFAGPRGTAELSYDDKVYHDPDQVTSVVADLTGIASEESLRSTASVRHGELHDLDRDEGALRDRLQRSISGADHGIGATRRQLADALRRYRGDGTDGTGLIPRTLAELEHVRAEHVAGETALGQLERDRNTLALAHDRRAALDERLAHDQEAVEVGERAVRLETSATEAEARYMRLHQAAELQLRITAAERAQPLPIPLPELRERTRRVKELQFQIQELEVATELRMDSPVELPKVERPPRWQPVALGAMIVLVAAVVAMGASTLTDLVPAQAAQVVASVLLVVAIILGVVAVRMARRVRTVKLRAQLQEAEINRRLQGRGQDDEQLRDTRRERDSLLTSIGVADVYQAETLLERAAAHSASIDELRAELRGLLAGVEVSGDVVAERDRAAAEMEQSRHLLSVIAGARTDPAAVRERALRTLNETQAEREATIQEEGQAQGRVDQNEVDAEQVAELAERAIELEGVLAAMERRVRVYELTLATLDAAEGDSVTRAARYLEQRMGDDLGRITDGRYRQVRVDEHDLSFHLWSPERADWVPVRELSQATLDQVYLAARLGLVRQVTQDRRPPLILDDPFVTFDDDRATHAAELLKDLAGDHQVVYLTSSDRYDTVADSVIELPAPTARDSDGPSAARVALASARTSTKGSGERAHANGKAGGSHANGKAGASHTSDDGAAGALDPDAWPALASTEPAPWATVPSSATDETGTAVAGAEVTD
jgi:DNA repair exonuclease SbcCD ATPase subunit